MRLFRLDPRRERRARLAVYGGLAALLVLLVVSTWLLERLRGPRVEPGWTEEDLADHPEVELLRDYVRVDTSQATGSELAGARFLAARLEAAGIPVHVESLGGGRANLWAILEGEERQALVLHNHIDVSPVADPERWDHPPFAAEIDAAWLYGRGVFDMKSVAVAQLEALVAIKRSGRKPRRSVIFLATGSEEVGSELGARWILAAHPELAERFWAVLTEGGVVEPTTTTDVKYWGIEFAQKQFAEAAACAAEREPLEELHRTILDWGSSAEVWRRTREVDAFLAAYAASRDRELYRELLAETWKALDDPEKFRQLPPFIQSMFRDEIVPFDVEEDAGGGFRMRIFYHLLPGSDLEEVRRRLLPEWITRSVGLTEGPALGAGHGSPLDHPAYEALVATVAESYPEAHVGPYFVSWSATDSRFFRAAGIPSYGFSPFIIFSTDTFRVDAANERIGLPGFVRGVELYRQVVRRLAG